jgi:hypothetical protein
MGPADRNKILIAGGVAVVAIALILFFVLRGRRPAVPAGAGFGAGQAVEQAEAGGPGQMPAPGEAEPAAAGGEEAPAAVAAAPSVSVGVVEMGTGPAEPTRTDPFETFHPPPVPTPPELLVPLPTVALGPLRPPGAGAGPRVGNRRVAGLLFNDQAWAILEDEDGQTFIVKPGDVVDGIRITAIARDSIYLMDSDGRKWQVPLRGLGPGSTAVGARSTVSALPSLPPA